MSSGTIDIADGFWQIGESIVFERYLNEICQVIVSVTAKLLNLKVCSLMMIDEEKKEFYVSAVHGAGPQFLNKSHAIMKIWEGVSGRTIKEKRPVEIPDIAADEKYRFPELARNEGLVSLMSVPIRMGKKIVGVLNSYTGERHTFTGHEITVLKAVASQAAMAIESQRLRDENKLAKEAFEKRDVIDQAKNLVMEKKGLKEDEAYKLLRRASRQYQKPLSELAKAVILAFSLDEQKVRSELV